MIFEGHDILIGIGEESQIERFRNMVGGRESSLSRHRIHYIAGTIAIRHAYGAKTPTALPARD